MHMSGESLLVILLVGLIAGLIAALPKSNEISLAGVSFSRSSRTRSSSIA